MALAMADKVDEAASWSNYWETQRTQAFDPQDGVDERIETLWTDFFSNCPDGSALLDIGCGNGALARLLNGVAERKQESYAYTGVDQASIRPISGGSLSEIETTFVADKPIESAQFGPQSFDRVVSQFGFEYCQPNITSELIMSWLKPGGKALFLVHTEESQISKEVRYTLEQMRMAEESALLVVIYRLLERLDQLSIKGQKPDDQCADLRQLINTTCDELETVAQDLPDPLFLKSFVSFSLGFFSQERSHIPPSVKLDNLTLFSNQLLQHRARSLQQAEAALDDEALSKLRIDQQRQGLIWQDDHAIKYGELNIGNAIFISKRE